MQKVLLLGASGSIGTQTIDVILNHEGFELTGFSVGKNIDAALEILKKFPNVKYVYVIDKANEKRILDFNKDINVYSGEEGLLELTRQCPCTMVVNALVGFVGLEPTLIALNRDLIVALANKEALVVGGELVNDLLAEGHGVIYPIDSEHAAIHKCLAVDNKDVKRLIITASGGAFRKYSREETKNLKKEDALKHPTWNMGAKITIDCATMVNKTFEVIEAHYLFNYSYDRISILLHDESMIHSMVEYNDGTYRGEISHPDMRNPIYYAMTLGKCIFDTYTSDDYRKFGDYHFHKFDMKRYPIVRYAKKVIEDKGIFGAVLNASNEVAVYSFLNDEISFLQIEEIISKCMDETINIPHPSFKTIKDVDAKTRLRAKEIIKEMRG